MFDEKFIALALVFLLANAIEAIAGFGGTIIAVTIAANFYPIEKVVPLLVPPTILVSLYLVLRYRDKVDVDELFGGSARAIRTRTMPPIGDLFSGILPFAFMGMLLGIAIFSVAKSNWLKLGYGLFVFCFSIFELVRIQRCKEGVALQPLSRLVGSACLFCAGVIHGIYASGGPLMVFYSCRKLPDKTVFRSTLSYVWLVLNVFVLIGHLLKGVHSIETLKMMIALMPTLIVGIIIGEKLHHRMPEKFFRVLVYVILVFAGGALVYSSLGVFK